MEKCYRCFSSTSKLDDVIAGGWSLMLGRCGSGLLFSIWEWQYLCLCSTVYLWLQDGCGLQKKCAAVCHFQDPDVIPQYLVVVVPSMFGNCRFIQLSCSLLSLWLPLWGLWSLFSSLLCTHVTVTLDLVSHVGFLFQCILILDLHQLPALGHSVAIQRKWISWEMCLCHTSC